MMDMAIYCGDAAVGRGEERGTIQREVCGLRSLRQSMSTHTFTHAYMYATVMFGRKVASFERLGSLDCRSLNTIASLNAI